MTLGNLLSRSFDVTFRQAGVFFPIALLAHSPLILITLFAGKAVTAETVDFGAGYGIAFFVSLATFFLLQTLQIGAMAYGVFRQMSGRSASLGECLGAAGQRFGSLLGVTILSGILTMLGMVLCIIPGIVLAIGLFVVAPVVMVERDLGITDTLKRSWDLTDGYKVTILAFLIVIGLITALPSILAVFVPIVVLGEIITLVAQVFAATGQSVAAGVVYHELRTSKEGTATDDLLAVFD